MTEVKTSEALANGSGTRKEAKDTRKASVSPGEAIQSHDGPAKNTTLFLCEALIIAVKQTYVKQEGQRLSSPSA